MITEMKQGLRLIRYGYGFKLNLGIAVFFLAFGIFFSVVGVIGMFIGTEGVSIGVLVGFYYVMLAPTMLIQIQYTLLYSGMVTSSAKRRLLEIILPDFLTIVSGGLGYIFMVTVIVVVENIRPEQVQFWIDEMVVVGTLACIMLIYFGAAYKFFWTSGLMLVVGIVIGVVGGMIIAKLLSGYLNLLTASLLSLVFVVVGILISAFLRRLFYKKQISPMAGGMSLRKAMR